jgi:hypothetical protein
MGPRYGMADVQAVSSHRHISLRTAKPDLPGKLLCFGPFCGSEWVLYGDYTTSSQRPGWN